VKGRATFRAWRWDGKRIASHRGGIPLDDRGFRYGQHLFESIAVRNGSALLAREHLTLLSAAAKRHAVPFSRSLASSLRSFLGQVRLTDGMIRIYLTAGAGAPAAPITAPGCYLTWEATPFPTPSAITRGCCLVTLKKPFSGAGWGEKSGSYEPHLAALTDAREAGADEGIVLDGKGRVISCAMANLLVWIPSRSGPVPCTPRPQSGARPGTVLSWVRGHIRVVERDLRASDLRRATAMAVTNSRLGVMPAVFLDGAPLSDPDPARRLALDYLRHHGLLGDA
jgi:branched-subunit amino acid aminotransferase/4-amino-4-deoxychorismate lyase